MRTLPAVLFLASVLHATTIITTEVGWSARLCPVTGHGYGTGCVSGISGNAPTYFNDGRTMIEVGFPELRAKYGDLVASGKAYSGAHLQAGVTMLIPELVYAKATVSFVDRITIFGPPSGMIEFTIASFMHDSRDPFPNAYLKNEFRDAEGSYALPPVPVVVSVPFTAGVPVLFGGTSTAQVTDALPVDSGSGGDTVMAALRIIDIAVAGESAWSYATESGTVYPTTRITALSTPEPSTVVLFCFGVGFFILRYRV